jgi:hypothetical protein
MKNNIEIFTLLCLGQIAFDNVQFPCPNICGQLLIIVHHILAIYIVFGSVLFERHKLHLFVICMTLFLNMIGHMCPITKWHNNICGHPPDTYLPTYLNHIFKGCAIPTLRKIYKCLLLFVISYDVKHVIYR